MLHGLVSELRRLPPLSRTHDQMAHLLAQAGTATRALPALPRQAGAYTRACAYVDDRFEVLLLDWSQGAVSEIHDHGAQHCWFVVLDGRLHVDDYRRLDAGLTTHSAVIEACGSLTLGPGDLDVRRGRFDIHRVAATHGNALTLHVYARPLREFSIYDLKGQRCKSVRAEYDVAIPVIGGAA